MRTSRRRREPCGQARGPVERGGRGTLNAKKEGEEARVEAVLKSNCWGGGDATRDSYRAV